MVSIVKLRDLISEDPVSSASRVHLFERDGGATVEDSLGKEAMVLVEPVGGHAGFEVLELLGAHGLEDGLAWGTFVFTGETAQIS